MGWENSKKKIIRFVYGWCMNEIRICYKFFLGGPNPNPHPLSYKYSSISRKMENKRHLLYWTNDMFWSAYWKYECMCLFCCACVQCKACFQVFSQTIDRRLRDVTIDWFQSYYTISMCNSEKFNTKFRTLQLKCKNSIWNSELVN